MGLFDGLPSGWSQAKDPQGKVYYYNRTSGETSYTKPEKPGGKASSSALPKEWAEAKDASGTTYYYNKFGGIGGGNPFAGLPGPPPGAPPGAPPYGGAVDVSDMSTASAKLEKTERQLYEASDRLTANTTDASAAFLARYRGGVGRGRALGGVQQTALGGAPLTDKHGNLI